MEDEDLELELERARRAWRRRTSRKRGKRLAQPEKSKRGKGIQADKGRKNWGFEKSGESVAGNPAHENGWKITKRRTVKQTDKDNALQVLSSESGRPHDEYLPYADWLYIACESEESIINTK